MTKRHFIELADYLRSVPDGVPPTVVDAICRFCRNQNPKFDEDRFRGYLAGECGPNGGKTKEKQ